MRRADPLITGRELAVEHDLVEGFAVDRQVERLAHVLRLAERALILVVGHVDGEAEIAELGRGRQHEAGIGPHILDVGRKHPLDQI